MNGEQRRKEIIQKLTNSSTPIPGTKLAEEFEVSRQVIVQDIALIRSKGEQVISTNRGYMLQTRQSHERVFKVIHTDDEVEEELTLIVDLGGYVQDVFVYHKVYGVVRGELGIASRMDVERYMNDIKTGKSSLLKNVTAGYHYHTITAPSEMLLDLIQEKLQQRGFLAKLQDYEPVDFWGDEE